MHSGKSYFQSARYPFYPIQECIEVEKECTGWFTRKERSFLLSAADIQPSIRFHTSHWNTERVDADTEGQNLAEASLLYLLAFEQIDVKIVNNLISRYINQILPLLPYITPEAVTVAVLNTLKKQEEFPLPTDTRRLPCIEMLRKIAPAVLAQIGEIDTWTSSDVHPDIAVHWARDHAMRDRLVYAVMGEHIPPLQGDVAERVRRLYKNEKVATRLLLEKIDFIPKSLEQTEKVLQDRIQMTLWLSLAKSKKTKLEHHAVAAILMCYLREFRKAAMLTAKSIPEAHDHLLHNLVYLYTILIYCNREISHSASVYHTVLQMLDTETDPSLRQESVKVFSALDAVASERAGGLTKMMESAKGLEALVAATQTRLNWSTPPGGDAYNFFALTSTSASTATASAAPR